jgi:hypothetical protein
VARKYLDPRRAVVATVKPEEATPALAKPKEPSARAGAKAARAASGRARRP